MTEIDIEAGEDIDDLGIGETRYNLNNPFGSLIKILQEKLMKRRKKSNYL